MSEDLKLIRIAKGPYRRLADWDHEPLGSMSREKTEAHIRKLEEDLQRWRSILAEMEP